MAHKEGWWEEVKRHEATPGKGAPGGGQSWTEQCRAQGEKQAGAQEGRQIWLEESVQGYPAGWQGKGLSNYRFFFFFDVDHF